MKLECTPLVDVQRKVPQSVRWLWPGRIAAGRLTLLDGDPGEGKSLLALDIASRLTSGNEFPDGYRPSEPASVLVLSREDDLLDTILPRALAAGADLKRVRAWDEAAHGRLLLPEACPLLQELVQHAQVRLVVLDPFFAFLGQDVGSLNDLMIRRALDPLVRVAETTQAAFLLIRHLGKDVGTRQAIYRGLGSIAILGTARTAFLVAPDADNADLRVFACTKNNLAPLPPSLGFRIGQTEAGLPLIEWQGPVPITADDLVAARRRRGEAVPQALAFLRQRLADGPCERGTLVHEAELVGISFRTLERAKVVLGVLSQQRREQDRNVWYWGLGG